MLCFVPEVQVQVLHDLSSCGLITVTITMGFVMFQLQFRLLAHYIVHLTCRLLDGLSS